MGRALAACLRAKGFAQSRNVTRARRVDAVALMLSQPRARVASASHHVRMAGADAARLRAECGRLLYVTSCKPMRHRLWSAAKFQFSVGMGNSTLTAAQKDDAVRVVERDDDSERMLEAYPYLGRDDRPNRTPPDRWLRPHYVVRAARMQHDLGSLLEALGCEQAFDSQNVHRAKEDDLAFLDRIRLTQGDATFRRLSARADVANEDGLQKAREFMEYAMQERFEPPEPPVST